LHITNFVFALFLILLHFAVGSSFANQADHVSDFLDTGHDVSGVTLLEVSKSSLSIVKSTLDILDAGHEVTISSQLDGVLS